MESNGQTGMMSRLSYDSTEMAVVAPRATGFSRS